MRALELSAFGLAHLGLVEREVPRPREHEVLVRLRAASISLRDYKVAAGAYQFARARLPLIVGSEGAGEIVERGAGVDGLSVGDRVMPLFLRGWIAGRPRRAALAGAPLGGPFHDGTLAEYIALPADAVVATPSRLSDLEAATLPLAGVTAWRALTELGQVRAGDLVVVQGTGGVQLHALQLAKLAGARVIVTSKNEDKLWRAGQLGADYVINYTATPDWSARVVELSGGEGADVVLDPGGSASMRQSLRAVRPGGAIVVVGALASAELEVHLPELLGRGIGVHGCFGGARAAHEALARAMATSLLHPVIERVVPLEGAIEALGRMAGGEQLGKVCVQL